MNTSFDDGFGYIIKSEYLCSFILVTKSTPSQFSSISLLGISSASGFIAGFSSSQSFNKIKPS